MSDAIQMTPERWERTTQYIRALFAHTDAGHAGVMERAAAAGLPNIDVGAESGRFLQLLTMITGGRIVIEVGTLAGYSAIWIARGLVPMGLLYTIEASSKHAEIARREIEAAGVADRVEIRQGRGSEVLPKLLDEHGRDFAELIFFDAERTEYLPMLDTAHALLRGGGVLAIDNALAAKRWTADPIPAGEAPDTMDIVNRAIADDARFVSVLVPVGNGILLAVKR